jgi:hypothetical protein
MGGGFQFRYRMGGGAPSIRQFVRVNAGPVGAGDIALPQDRPVPAREHGDGRDVVSDALREKGSDAVDERLIVVVDERLVGAQHMWLDGTPQKPREYTDAMRSIGHPAANTRAVAAT